jgi:SAM-dependent methyltransferase
VTDAGRAFWSGRVERFATLAADEQSFYAYRALRVADLVADLAPAGLALDVGCGNGALGLLLGEAGREVLGLDLSQAQVARARAAADARGLTARCRFTIGGLEEASRHRCAAVTAIGVLPYVQDQPAFLEGLARCVSPGGLLVVTLTRAFSVFTIVALARHVRAFRPTRAWVGIAINLLCTGVWSGGFLHPRARRVRRASQMDAILAGAGFARVKALPLHNFAPLDRSTRFRGRLGGVAWCWVLCYRRAVVR